MPDHVGDLATIGSMLDYVVTRLSDKGRVPDEHATQEELLRLIADTLFVEFDGLSLETRFVEDLKVG